MIFSYRIQLHNRSLSSKKQSAPVKTRKGRTVWKIKWERRPDGDLSPPRRPPSIGESCSALCASSLEDVSAVGSLHSFTEAVFLFALTLLRLICSKHILLHLLKRDRKFYFSRCLTDRNIISQNHGFCQVFYATFDDFERINLYFFIIKRKKRLFLPITRFDCSHFTSVYATDPFYPRSKKRQKTAQTTQRIG